MGFGERLQLTGIAYLDLCCWLRGKVRNRVWLGSLGEARRQLLVKPVLIEFKKFGKGIGYVPMGWQGLETPDRIAILGLTPCGRVEVHRKISDGRNASIFDKVVRWSQIIGVKTS